MSIMLRLLTRIEVTMEDLRDLPPSMRHETSPEAPATVDGRPAAPANDDHDDNKSGSDSKSDSSCSSDLYIPYPVLVSNRLR
ncbi:hypothetical protein M514_03399 [Trichuris suis]|uniref:Uncharacterized protein n=1 Tax=Trichuris suis TaxID=68888 RepID=A0A085MEK5_9BILA|nr:hypothetical protein M513_03399 [Trichuris suis]KFD68065.1 hypothetical protein M514_03399 [Trichuris suis]